MKISVIDSESRRSKKLVENLIKRETVFSLVYNDSWQSQRQSQEQKIYLVNTQARRY